MAASLTEELGMKFSFSPVCAQVASRGSALGEYCCSAGVGLPALGVGAKSLGEGHLLFVIEREIGVIPGSGCSRACGIGDVG